MHDVIPQSVAPLESELGDDDPYDVQVVTLGTNHIPPRRYDLSDLGDPAYFQGWADVQGTGAANDYCRYVACLLVGGLAAWLAYWLAGWLTRTVLTVG